MSDISQYNLNLSLDWIYFRTQNICFDNKLAPGMNWKPIAINLADISNLKWKVYLHIDWSHFLSISVTDRGSALLGSLLGRSTQASLPIVRVYSHSFRRRIRAFQACMDEADDPPSNQFSSHVVLDKPSVMIYMSLPRGHSLHSIFINKYRRLWTCNLQAWKIRRYFEELLIVGGINEYFLVTKITPFGGVFGQLSTISYPMLAIVLEYFNWIFDRWKKITIFFISNS